MKDIYKSKKMLVISSAPLIVKDDGYAAYSPYSQEMEIWARNTGEIWFCCPVWGEDRGLLNSPLHFKIDGVCELKEFSFKGIVQVVFSINAIFFNFFSVVNAMRKSDHFHLRCPGNIGLLACIAQIFFPSKKKSAKYAGNWDPNAKQPLSYKMQKWILSNTFLTKNISVLVYGDWPNQSNNIKSFFTATYNEADKVDLPQKRLNGTIKFVSVGTLSEGKRPLYALKVVEQLYKNGFEVKIDFYGEGLERIILEKYIINNALSTIAKLHGNKDKDEVLIAYQDSHFLILPSKSEGWPKVVAEAMFWGVVPIVTSVSCTPNMLDFGSRGLLLNLNLHEDIDQISSLIRDGSRYVEMSTKASMWSREFTLDKFENEIELIISK